MRTYRVTITFEKWGGKRIVFAIPETGEYQIIRNLSIAPSPKQVISDKWGNMVSVFTLNDVGNISVRFLHSPKFIKKHIPERYMLKDYKKSSQNALYLESGRFVNGEDKTIQKIAKSAIGRGDASLADSIRLLYEHALKYLSYGKPIEGLYPYSQAVKEKVTDCGGFSTFLLSLCQSLGIPGRLVVGFLLKEVLATKFLSQFSPQDLSFKSLAMHAWPEILLPDGNWFPMDPSIEWRRKKGQTKRKGGFGIIPDDRLVLSYGFGHEVTVDNKRYTIDIFQNPLYL